MLQIISFIPLSPVSDIERISHFQLLRSEYFWYIPNKSATNNDASSPPVPARISSIEFLWSLRSLGINNLSKFKKIIQKNFK